MKIKLLEIYLNHKIIRIGEYVYILHIVLRHHFEDSGQNDVLKHGECFKV